MHEQALADRERVLGPSHPDTPQSRSNLAARGSTWLAHAAALCPGITIRWTGPARDTSRSPPLIPCPCRGPRCG
jgi:hypothetical protein